MNVPPPRILVVDDEPPVRAFLEEALRSRSTCVCTASGLRQALAQMDDHPHDVVLADICMLDCSGMDILDLSHRLNWDCSVILMTGHASLDQVVGGVRMHAADFLLKPFTLDTLQLAVDHAYRCLLDLRYRREEHEVLSCGLRQRTEELESARQVLAESHRAALETLVATLEAREYETYAHSFRVRAYSLHLAKLLNYSPASLNLLGYAALLHDIGKLAIPDAILLKPGPLSPQEFDVLKTHSVVGERIVRRMGFLKGAASIIRHHHERWDGRGYPDGLSASQIPVGSRLFAVADTLDAMTSDRCYRKALTLPHVRSEMNRCSGIQFDPEIASAFQTVPFDVWNDLRLQADRDAQAAIIPEVQLLSKSANIAELLQQFASNPLP